MRNIVMADPRLAVLLWQGRAKVDSSILKKNFVERVSLALYCHIFDTSPYSLWIQLSIPKFPYLSLPMARGDEDRRISFLFKIFRILLGLIVRHHDKFFVVRVGFETEIGLIFLTADTSSASQRRQSCLSSGLFLWIHLPVPEGADRSARSQISDICIDVRVSTHDKSARSTSDHIPTTPRFDPIPPIWMPSSLQRSSPP